MSETTKIPGGAAVIVIPVTPLELVGIVCGAATVVVISFALLTLLATLVADHEWGSAFWAVRWPVAILWGVLAGYGLAQLT